MDSKTVKVVVIDGKKIEKTISLHPGKSNNPQEINAVDDGKYILAEDNTGVAPENITVTRKGNDLFISIEGEDGEKPQLVIKGYYQHPSQLVGMGEDGAYHQYIATDAALQHEASQLVDGVASPLALGSQELIGFGDGLVADDSNGLLYPVLIGLGILGLGLLGAAIASNHGGGHHGSDDEESAAPGAPPVVPEVPVAPATPNIDSVTDNVGTITGPIPDGGVTDDNTPTLDGSGQTPGDTVVISDNGDVIGSTVVGPDGNWVFTPDTPLPDGSHTIDVVVVTPGGTQSPPSGPVTIIVDTVAPDMARNEVLTDDVESQTGPIADYGITNDNQPTLSGTAEPGTTVEISDNGVVIGSAAVDEKGNWTFTPSTPLQDGDHVFSTVVTDPAGNRSLPDQGIHFTVDTTAPDVPGNLLVTDDVGTEIGPVPNGGTTDDNTPTLSGSEQNAGDIITVYDQDKIIGSALVDANGNWTLSVTPALPDGEHNFTLTATDPAGNASAHSPDYIVNIDTSVGAPVPPLVSGQDDLESSDLHVFQSGDSVTLGSGMTLTCIDPGIDGSSKNIFTEITDTGIHLIVPEFGYQALSLMNESQMKISFGGPTDAVSFAVNSSNYPGSMVNFYDANGNLLHTEALPVQTGEAPQTVGWTATGGDEISYIVISVSEKNPSGGSAIDGIRIDDIAWGDNATVPPATFSTGLEHGMASPEHFSLNLDGIAHSSVDPLNDVSHLNVTINDVLSSAHAEVMTEKQPETHQPADLQVSEAQMQPATMSGEISNTYAAFISAPENLQQDEMSPHLLHG